MIVAFIAVMDSAFSIERQARLRLTVGEVSTAGGGCSDHGS